MSKKAVIVDAYCGNPGDITWEPIATHCKLSIYDRSSQDEVRERCADAEIIFTNKVPFSAELIKDLPKLQYIGVLATGFNIIDCKAAKAADITVTNIPAYSSKSVAQHVLALLLEHCSDVGSLNTAVHNGEWVNCPDFCFTKRTLRELSGSSIALVGYGEIAREVSKVCAAMGMKILINTRTQNPSLPAGVEAICVDRDTMAEEADIISLHCPLTPETEKMINAEFINKCKRKPIIINTGRGPLLDEKAVATALKDGALEAALIDVLSTEPPTADNPLLSAPNCIITPHTAWATQEARIRLIDIAANNLQAYLAGNAQNVVN